MWTALRYRKGQAAALAALAALVTACAVFAPLYDRTMLQSLVDVRLAHTTPLLSGLQVESSAREQSGGYYTKDPAGAMAPAALLDEVPRSARASYDEPVLGWTDNVVVQPDRPGSLAGQLMWRTDQCDHVHVTGRCPEAAGETLVSSADLAALHLKVGQTLTVADPRPVDFPVGPTRELTIVGSYDVVPGDDWFVFPLTGSSGAPTESIPVHTTHDAWLTVEETFSTGQPLMEAGSYVGLRLRPERVGADEVLQLGDTLTRLRAATATESAASGPRIRITTGLTDIADDVRSQQRDSRVIVPLLMAQLGLLGLVVLWLALGAITDLRRSEIAVARLRGRGARGARRLVLGELVPAVALGVVPGVLVAWAGDLVAARILPGEAGAEVRLPVLVALVGVVAVLLLTTLLGATRVSRLSVDALLRRSSSVRRGWRVGVLDAVLISGCGGLVAAFLTGSLEGPIALVAPALVALLVGLLLAHLLTPLAATTGRLLLRRGRARAAVGLLEAARSPALRSTVTVVTIAAALAVFSLDSLVVADRNRAAAAEQEAGAPLVATLTTRYLDTVEETVDGIGGVTPVVRLKAPAVEAATTLATHPDDFRRIALLPHDEQEASGWHRLAPDDVEPVSVTGSRMSLRVTTDDLSSIATDRSSVDVTLGADIADAHHVFHTELGTVPRHGSRVLGTDIICTKGCSLVAITLSTFTGSTMTGAVTVDGLTVNGRPEPLGDAWLPFEDPNGGRLTPVPADDGLTLTAASTGQQRLSVSQAWVPQAVPALITSATPRDGFTLTGLDGRTRAAQVVGTIDRVPGAPARTAVVDLDLLGRGAALGSDARIELWASDAAALHRATRALDAKGVGVTDTRSIADVRRAYDESTAAWSVGLGLVVGLAAIIVSLILLAVLAVSGWRVRARDLAALWLSGVPRRAVRRLAWTAQLPAVVLGALAGAACGLVGAAVSMPIVPLFAEAPGVSTLDLATPWLPVVAVAGAALVVLAGWSTALGWSVFRRAALERLRETA